MEQATDQSDLNFRTTVRHLYVEVRDLTRPVTLDYPTFEAAQAACGLPRIWAGIHWPADNQRGQELGLKVAENAWSRYQQFVLGYASPAIAAFMTVSPACWMHENEVADHRTSFELRRGPGDGCSAGASRTRQCSVLDPMPAGDYLLRLKVAVSGDHPARLTIAVRPCGAQGTPVAESTVLANPSEHGRILTLPQTSDGTLPFRLSINAEAQDRSARIIISAVGTSRVWPVRGGAQRYYAPSIQINSRSIVALLMYVFGGNVNVQRV